MPTITTANEMSCGVQLELEELNAFAGSFAFKELGLGMIGSVAFAVDTVVVVAMVVVSVSEAGAVVVVSNLINTSFE